ncbi:hypothetical protein ASF06_04110 [Agreia sp. Leaf244]|uniref:HNH endonuclease signature motif containing protein n=1 Tax=Agreia sp. Leaf244 TaxID=1736305 RepID=UPI0006F3E563|nr:HNH endonuclease signature motif containing protein [Agreia sp. Leaf244]KQO11811.1 hypothetical protein ASF06_04110 [Agreia sp. Leaf244]
MTTGTPASRRETLLGSLRIEVDAIVEDERAVARIHARRAERIERAYRLALELAPTDQSTGGPKWSTTQVAERQLATELAVELRVTENEAYRLMSTGRGLIDSYQATLDGLKEGTFSYRHAHILVRFGVDLPDEARAEFEETMLSKAADLTVVQFENLARRLTEEVQHETCVERFEKAAGKRSLTRDDAADGMAYLTHYLPAVEAVAIENLANAIAISARNAGDPRTLVQLRVDALSDLILGGSSSIPGVVAGIRPKIAVTVPALTLLGHGTEPATLEGYGPIDDHTAGHLVATAPSFLRVLTDPVTGSLLAEGQKRYRPGAILDDFVKLLHRSCRFPQCTRPAGDSDTDHTHDHAQGGETYILNLAPLSPKHHRVKHHTSWSVKQLPDSSLEWTSPLGHITRTPPPVRMRPAPPVPEKRPPVDEGDPPF